MQRGYLSVPSVPFPQPYYALRLRGTLYPTTHLWKDFMERQEAENLLKTSVNDPNATFHPGQWEAIDALVNQRRKMLVVQRTGWGKSSVYFISTRIMRDSGMGPTLIVSPLLALMRNQLEAAGRLGVHAETINSTNRDVWEAIKQQILEDEVDALLISPERLSNEEFVEEILLPISDRVGLLVVDEAHCISDWGHDFRPDYRRIIGILRQMPPNMPVLGTTATANNRVIEDVQTQLGDIDVQRGSLARESLHLQTLRSPSQGARLAWLAQNISSMAGTGIVYVLTKRDAEQVAAWLNSQSIDALAYYSGVKHEDFGDSTQYRLYLEDLLLNNEVKALVATTALGMGYDKPDLGFVIHYQSPSSAVSYYQQVGRAGRAIEKAHGILLAGYEDSDIHEYFRRSAFPNEQIVQLIIHTLGESDGLSIRELEQRLNIRRGQIDKVLKLISVESPAPVYKLGSKWSRTPVQYHMDRDRIERLTQQREVEWQEIQDYIDSNTCLMTYLRNALDDPDAVDCGRCSVCLKRPVISESVDTNLAIAVARFLRRAEILYEPRKQVPPGSLQLYGISGNLRQDVRASEGRILSRWRDAGWGDMVANDKSAGRFRDELVEAVSKMYEQRWQPEPKPEWVTCVPSQNNPTLVPDFARRLANRLGLPFMDAIQKVRDNEPQKNQQNNFHQCRNLDGAFAISDGIPETPVLLVDDIVDSRWTITVLAALLRQNGSGPVYPVALASTTPGG